MAYGPMSKVFAVENYQRDSTDLLDLAAPHSIIRQPGGLGLLERDHRRSTASTIYAGASEVLRSMIGEKALRSEEHTSELQSLMRISYAVFCLKKNTSNERITVEIIDY